jgi:hypothetical protein
MRIKNLFLPKNWIKIALHLLIFLLVFSWGCEKLDFPDPNSPIVEDVSVQPVVTGIEAGMRVDLAIYIRVVSIIGRESYYFEPADPRYTGELLFGTPDPGGFLLERPWSARYRVVKSCQILLDKATELSGDSKAGVEGFAKTIMAYQLLLNLNLLDENGIKIDFSGDLNAPFVSKSEAFGFIENLLDEGNADLANAGNSFPFQLSSGFAGFDTPAGFTQLNRALRARVAVFQGKWDDALNALDDSFLNPSGDLNNGVYHVYGTGLGDQTNEIFETPDAPFVKLMGHPSYATDAEAGDPRFSTKVFVRTDSTTFDDLTTNLAVTILNSSTDPYPLIRNEELILLRAEANIGLNQLGTAEQDINAVRMVHGLSEITLTSQNAVDQLLNEKRYSLYLEGHRWVDMRRYGKLNELPIDRTTDIVLDKMPRPEKEEKGR